MGTSYSAISGIGLKINLHDLPAVESTRPSCPHPEAAGNKFCPKCGTKVKTIKEKNYEISNTLLERLPVIPLPVGYIFEGVDYDSGEYFLGWGFTNMYDGCRPPYSHVPVNAIPNPDQVRNEIRHICEKAVEGLDLSFDIFDEKMFGYWNFISAN